MQQFIRDYFTFDRRHRNGVFVLLFIILLLLYCSFAGQYFPTDKLDFSQFEKEVEEFEAAVKKAGDSAAQSHINYFSGNILVPDSGETEKSSGYERKFQKFERKNFERKKYPEKSSMVVELNTADTISLKQLKGIGSAFAKRIVKYRDLLGGFVRKEQLLEVYGFDNEKYSLVAPQVEVNAESVKKLNINSASVEMLKKHPYIDKTTASKIYWHRINHGSYSDVSDILKTNLADEQTFAKIAPYLTTK